MRYREEELEKAIDKYVDGLDRNHLYEYVWDSMMSAYYKADDETIDEFIFQMDTT